MIVLLLVFIGPGVFSGAGFCLACDKYLLTKSNVCADSKLFRPLIKYILIRSVLYTPLHLGYFYRLVNEYKAIEGKIA